jgi:hypothetical protein
MTSCPVAALGRVDPSSDASSRNMIGCAAGHELGLPRATGRLKKYTQNRTPLRHRTPRRAEFPHLWLQHYLHRTVCF